MSHEHNSSVGRRGQDWPKLTKPSGRVGVCLSEDEEL